MGTKEAVVYTACTWDKDTPQEGVRVFKDYKRFKDPRLNAKIYKILPHLFLDCEISIYIDANVRLKKPLEFYTQQLGKYDMAVFAHPYWDTVAREAEEVKRRKKDDPKVVDEQVERYRNEGFTDDYGLGAGYILIRRHTTLQNRLNERWWAEITRGSVRDQLSMMYVFKDNIKFLPKQINRNQFFIRVGHT